jgi:hypothetical protein
MENAPHGKKFSIARPWTTWWAISYSRRIGSLRLDLARRCDEIGLLNPHTMPNPLPSMTKLPRPNRLKFLDSTQCPSRQRQRTITNHWLTDLIHPVLTKHHMIFDSWQSITLPPKAIFYLVLYEFEWCNLLSPIEFISPISQMGPGPPLMPTRTLELRFEIQYIGELCFW